MGEIELLAKARDRVAAFDERAEGLFPKAELLLAAKHHLLKAGDVVGK